MSVNPTSPGESPRKQQLLQENDQLQQRLATTLKQLQVSQGAAQGNKRLQQQNHELQGRLLEMSKQLEAMVSEAQASRLELQEQRALAQVAQYKDSQLPDSKSLAAHEEVFAEHQALQDQNQELQRKLEDALNQISIFKQTEQSKASQLSVREETLKREVLCFAAHAH